MSWGTIGRRALERAPEFLTLASGSAFKLALALACLVTSVGGSRIVAAKPVDGELPNRLDKILRASRFPEGQMGLVVFDLNQPGGSLAYAHNEERDFIPASVTKIATASAVLSRLGASFKFQTGLWSSGTIKEHALKGDLVLKGGGDAGFVSESMWFLVNEFVRTGVRRIEGDIVVDDSDFDTVRADPSRDPERVDRAYDAPVGAMSFNWNSINIYIRPGSTGGVPIVKLDPIDNGFTVDNKAKTVKGSANHLEVSRVGNRIVVRGAMGVETPEFAVYKNIDDPVQWCGHNLEFFLAQRGITVSGSVKGGKKSESAKLLAKAESKPVAQHVADMLKFSNNYVAEMLTKDLAAQNGVTPATLDEGMKLVRASMEQLGVEGTRFVLLNPSGLSRKNRIKPVDLAKILLNAQKNFPWFAEFLSALPLAGLDGTLKKRMKESQTAGWVRAKTGNLAGVVALAGFAGRKDGSLRAFAFIFNGRAESGEGARHLFDALAAELVQ